MEGDATESIPQDQEGSATVTPKPISGEGAEIAFPSFSSPSQSCFLGSRRHRSDGPAMGCCVMSPQQWVAVVASSGAEGNEGEGCVALASPGCCCPWLPSAGGDAAVKQAQGSGSEPAASH